MDDSGVSGLERLSREDLLALASAQAQTIDVLTARVAQLERLLSRNSGNSSMPPSTDDLPGRGKPERKRGKGSGRRPGKQPGASGSALGMVADPDEVLNLFPDACAGCGATDLGGGAGAGYVARQVIDIPPVAATVTEYRLHKVRCGCGHVTTASAQGVPDAPACYGPQLQALVVYLMVFQHVPVQRCVQLIADLTGTAVSAGWVHSMLARVAGALAGVEKLIKTLITAAHVAHFDETPLRAGAGPGKRQVHVAATDRYTAYHLGGRGIADMVAFGILPRFRGVAVRDGYAAYDSFDHIAAHQLCGAHILREVADAAQCYPDQHWPEQIARALRRLNTAAHTARTAGHDHIPPEIKNELVDQYRHGVLIGLKLVPRADHGPQPPARALLQRLHDRQADVLRFAADLTIPFTNNQGERDVRMVKLQQKISGRLPSEKTTRDRLRIRGYLSTAAKHGVNTMTALRDAVTGNPWTPPIPATT